MAKTPRRARILELTELEHGPGLEIAPLHSPIALKSEYDVSYVDIVPTEELLEHYGHDDAVPDDAIVEVDFPLTGPDGVIRPLSEVARSKSPFAWVIASHVIEHVPDLVGWLDDIATLLRDDGALVLAIPDMRFSFDAARPQTTVGQMLEAHERGDVVPSVRAVYDHFRSAVTLTLGEAWEAGVRPADAVRIHELDNVMVQVEMARRGEYVDSHVWTFRPSTFIDQVNELGRLGLCELVVETVRNTRPGQLEFYAVLRRLPRERTPEEDVRLRAAGKQRTDDERRRPRTQASDGGGALAGAGTDQQPVRLSESELRLVRGKRAAAARARRLLGRSG